MVAAEAATERKHVFFRVMRFREEVETKIRTSSSQSLEAFVRFHTPGTCRCTHSIDHSSVVDGDVQRVDHASAVVLHPM